MPLNSTNSLCFHLFHFSLKQSGGFYSAEDADSVPVSGGPEKREGAFCVWTASEVRELLPDVVEGATGAATQADVFMHHYGVKEQGNVTQEQVTYIFIMSHVGIARLDWIAVRDEWMEKLKFIQFRETRLRYSVNVSRLK